MFLVENARALGLSSWAYVKNRTNLDKSHQDLDYPINIFKEKVTKKVKNLIQKMKNNKNKKLI